MRFQLQHVFFLLSAVATASNFAAMPNDAILGSDAIMPRAACGPTPGPCNENNCHGYNDPAGGGSVCTAGDFNGCSCAHNCGKSPGSCLDNDCAGFNDPLGGLGICTGGQFAGCDCVSQCGTEPGPCNENNCSGVAVEGGLFGTCTTGDFKGCFCLSQCANHKFPCDQNNCGGSADDVDGTCTAGDFAGCPCSSLDNDHQCGNLESHGCNEFDCAGINFPEGGFGICTNKFKGCLCELTCGTENGPCDQHNCQGVDGKCTAGDFNGCACNP